MRDWGPPWTTGSRISWPKRFYTISTGSTPLSLRLSSFRCQRTSREPQRPGRSELLACFFTLIPRLRLLSDDVLSQLLLHIHPFFRFFSLRITLLCPNVPCISLEFDTPLWPPYNFLRPKLSENLQIDNKDQTHVQKARARPTKTMIYHRLIECPEFDLQTSVKKEWICIIDLAANPAFCEPSRGECPLVRRRGFLFSRLFHSADFFYSCVFFFTLPSTLALLVFDHDLSSATRLLRARNLLTRPAICIRRAVFTRTYQSLYLWFLLFAFLASEAPWMISMDAEKYQPIDVKFYWVHELFLPVANCSFHYLFRASAKYATRYNRRQIEW